MQHHPLAPVFLLAHHAAISPPFFNGRHLNMTGTEGTWVIVIAMVALAALLIRLAVRNA